MKAITLWQPWASLVACGAKKFETRSWATSYRGEIAIHAAARKCETKDIPAFAVYTMIQALRPITNKLAKTTMYLPLELLPRGAIIATAELMDCHQIQAESDGTPFYRYLPSATEILQLQRDFPGQKDYRGQRIRRFPAAERNELLFGDWTPGRYAWELANVQMLTEPILAKGKQGLWNWEEVR